MSRYTRDEQGSTTLFFVVIIVAIFLMIGLVVDGGGKIRALQRADSVAGEAARAGGQEIKASDAVQGRGVFVETAAAKRAARAYLAAASVQGDVQVTNGNRLRVTTTTHYSPVFLGLIGVGELTTHGSADVRLVQGIDGKER